MWTACRRRKPPRESTTRRSCCSEKPRFAHSRTQAASHSRSSCASCRNPRLTHAEAASVRASARRSTSNIKSSPRSGTLGGSPSSLASGVSCCCCGGSAWEEDDAPAWAELEGRSVRCFLVGSLELPSPAAGGAGGRGAQGSSPPEESERHFIAEKSSPRFLIRI